MRISEALPGIFKRTYPILEPGTQMLLAVSLLRFHQIDALPIGLKPRQRKRFAVFGYSCLSSLLKSEPKDYRKFLEMPCEKAALELATLDREDTIDSMLQMFDQTRFGFAWVNSPDLGGFATFRDLLPLYDSGAIQSDLSVDDIASPIFSMPANSSIKNVLREMFDHHFRRVFVEGERTLVTDRRVISYIFSSAGLSATFDKPESLLDARLGDLEKMQPIEISGGASLKTAAASMRDASEECLICEKGVVTPWDLIMKPRRMRRLKVK
ncbi:MAG: hypothetical protein JRN20_09720 [Nitrososphaerota archaeon]|nr:hypothetical protein [Nitrososphaerota archaeon]